MKVFNQWWMLLVERYEVLVHLNWLEIEVAVCGVFMCKKLLVEWMLLSLHFDFFCIVIMVCELGFGRMKGISG